MPKGWISRPATQGQDTYYRGSIFRAMSGTFDIVGDTNDPSGTTRSVMFRIHTETGVVLQSGTLTARPYTWACDTTKIREGNVVIEMVCNPPLPCLPCFAIVDNDGVRQAPGDVWVPYGSRNLTNDWINSPYGPAEGWQWRKYVVGQRPQGAKLTVRKGAGPINADIKHKDLWQQCMTQTHPAYSFPSREPVQMVPSGVITTFDVQTYNHPDAWSLYPGTCVDGPYGVGRVGPWSNGEVEADGSLTVCCPIGRIVNIALDGTVKTLLGLKLKDNVYPPPRFYDYYGSNDQSALLPYYELVGGIRPNNPWQCRRDPDDNGVLFWTDTDGDRVGRTDLIDGTTRYATGFNKPRGLVFSPDMSKLYVANDHASEICVLDPDNLTWTSLVKSARDNNDLVAAQSQFAPLGSTALSEYVKYIRSFMKDGPFGQAIFMHPNGLDIDSQGRILAFCHHPHVVIRIDPVAKTVETVVRPVVNMDIGYLAKSWCPIAVNRWGDDSISIAWWQQSSATRYTKDGTLVGFLTGPDEQSQPTAFLEQGPVSMCQGSDYPVGVAYGPDAFWHGAWAGEGAYRQTRRQASDIVIDPVLYQRGQNLYQSGNPAPFYVNGHRGMNKTGGKSFWEIAGMSGTTIVSELGAVSVAGADWPALAYYVRTEAAGVAGVAPPVVPPVTPPVTPPPVVPPPIVTPPTKTDAQRLADVKAMTVAFAETVRTA